MLATFLHRGFGKLPGYFIDKWVQIAAKQSVVVCLDI